MHIKRVNFGFCNKHQYNHDFVEKEAKITPFVLDACTNGNP